MAPRGRRRGPERAVHALRRLDDRAARALAPDVGRHVRPVGRDRVRAAVEVAERQVGEGVRGRARVAPDRRPQHERHAGGTGAGVGRREGDAPREAGHDRAEAPGGGEPEDGPLRRAEHGERELAAVRAAAAAVAQLPAHEREDHPLALVQPRERADAERRRVVRDEEDRPGIWRRPAAGRRPRIGAAPGVPPGAGRGSGAAPGVPPGAGRGSLMAPAPGRAARPRTPSRSRGRSAPT